MSFLKKIWEQIDDLIGLFQSQWKALVVLIIMALVTSFILHNPLHISLPTYQVGEVAVQDIRAPQPLVLEDTELTAGKKALAEQSVLEVYDYDADASQNKIEMIKQGFQFLKSQKLPLSEEARSQFEDKLNIKIKSEEWSALDKPLLWPSIQKALIYQVLWLYKRMILSDWPKQSQAIQLRDLQKDSERELSLTWLKQNAVLSKDVERLISQQNAAAFPDRSVKDPHQQAVITRWSSRLAEPNVSFNPVETAARKEEARSKVSAASIDIAQGEMIVREGDKIEKHHLVILEAIKNSGIGGSFEIFFALSLFVALYLVVFQSIGRRNFKKFKIALRDQITIGLFFIISLWCIKLMDLILTSSQGNTVAGISYKMMIPLSFFGMALRLILSMEITVFIMILFSLCVGWVLRSPYFCVVTLAAGLSGAASMRHITQRLHVFRAGLQSGFVQGLFLLLGFWMSAVKDPGFGMFAQNILGIVLFSLVAGILSSAIVLAVQPVIEFAGYTTDLRLMELSNTNHPVLKEMIIKAPGTYFHSFSVSQLAEKAAEAIHANALFARVSSLYHDIGKLKKPHYFIENIKGENKHDKLVPTMSALIIESHVKEGIELAQKYNLPRQIIDVIPQHHGTSLISYFYDKAKKEAAPDQIVDEREFRYPGPKPQTREAAIILLADAAEAAAKSLDTKTEEKFRETIASIVNRFFLDGQLDECDLTLKDLQRITDAFCQVLLGIYHQRIDYPHLKKDKGSSDERTSSIIAKLQKT